ncbi:MAG: hypothetical protein K0B10_08780 [Vicingaceae bacterium]|nr:hypothetical protein [Vicingaceae bacterium]
MKPILFLLLLFTLNACKQTKPIKENTSNTATETLKETIFISMERTPCLGRCPGYTITIYETGMVIYEGRDFVEREGKYSAMLSNDAMEELKNYINSINFFNLKDKYDKEITDIPSCIIAVSLDGKYKKIVDRYEAPDELRRLEKLIDYYVLTDNLKKMN